MVSDDQSTGAIGKIDRATGPRWDTVGDLKKKVEEYLQDAGQASGTAQTALVEAAYGIMRSWCEVVVERVILGDVSRRYRANIKMGGLHKIKPGRLPDAIKAMDRLYSKSCRYMPDHLQPLPTLSIRPTLAEAQQDWKAVLDAVEAYRNHATQDHDYDASNVWLVAVMGPKGIDHRRLHGVPRRSRAAASGHCPQ